MNMAFANDVKSLLKDCIYEQLNEATLKETILDVVSNMNLGDLIRSKLTEAVEDQIGDYIGDMIDEAIDESVGEMMENLFE